MMVKLQSPEDFIPKAIWCESQQKHFDSDQDVDKQLIIDQDTGTFSVYQYVIPPVCVQEICPCFYSIF